MKKILFAIILLIFTLAACAENGNVNADSENDTVENVEAVASNNEDKTPDVESGIEVEKKLLNVEVTLPPFFVEDENGEVNLDEIEENLLEEGIKDVKLNEDGSITIKMSKKQHKEMMTELNQNIQVTIDDLLNDEDITSFKDIQANKDYTKWDITVDKSVFENSFDDFAMIGLGITAVMYQAFDGQDLEKTDTIFNLIDEATGEKFDEIIYPDDFEEMDI